MLILGRYIGRFLFSILTQTALLSKINFIKLLIYYEIRNGNYIL